MTEYVYGFKDSYGEEQWFNPGISFEAAENSVRGVSELKLLRRVLGPVKAVRATSLPMKIGSVVTYRTIVRDELIIAVKWDNDYWRAVGPSGVWAVISNEELDDYDITVVHIA